MLEGRALKEHTLNRLGYGMSQWHSRRYDELGVARYVDEQLDGSLATTQQRGADVAAKIERAVVSHRQLEVVLLDFWFNHFNVDASGGLPKRTVGEYQADIHSHVLGRFGVMLLATAKAPAMLDYLDNRRNFAARVGNNGRVYGLNENYARELMELHTLGVDGGYSEADIIEVARVLTGWSVANDAYMYRPYHHDKDAKTVMGATFPAGREEDEGVDLLNLLAGHPSTASFVGRKLCRKLVSENPPTPVVNAAAAAFSTSGGDIKETVRAILGSNGFTDAATFRTKVKPPHRYLASAVLAMGASTTGHYAGVLDQVVDGVGDLGEEPYKVGPPTGYPEASGYWVSGSAMVGRFQLAGIIANNATLKRRLVEVSGATGTNAGAITDAVAAYMLPGGISSLTRQSAIAFVSNQAANSDRRIAAAAHVLLSSPEFVRF